MDMEDATAKDVTAESMAADSGTATMLQTASESRTRRRRQRPGRPMVAAQARIAQLASMAMQHKLLAYQLRETAMELAHRGTIPTVNL